MIKKTVVTISILAVLIVSALSTSHRAATINFAIQKTREVEDKQPVAEVSEPNCKREILSVFQASLEYLSSAAKPSVEGIRQAARRALSTEPEGLVAVALDQQQNSAFFVGYFCNVDATSIHGAFRVFRDSDTGYRVASTSKDFPILETTDNEGFRLEDASLEVAPLTDTGSKTNRTFWVTTWTRGGGRPALFSVIVWEWNGQVLTPVWDKLNLTNGTIKVIGPLIVLSLQPGPSEVDVSSNKQEYAEVYRLNNQAIVSEDTLSRALIESYLEDKVLVPQTSDDFYNIAYLWHSAGEMAQAATWYEKSIALDKTGNKNYLYLLVADVYEQQGIFQKAAKTLQEYRDSTKSKLTSEVKREINQRIESLQQRKN